MQSNVLKDIRQPFAKPIKQKACLGGAKVHRVLRPPIVYDTFVVPFCAHTFFYGYKPKNAKNPRGRKKAQKGAKKYKKDRVGTKAQSF